MRKALLLLIFCFLLGVTAHAQYKLDWYKVGKDMNSVIGFQHNDGKLVCTNTVWDAGYYKPEYSGTKILPIGRLHKKIQGRDYGAFAISFSISSAAGALVSSIISESFLPNYSSYSNGDTILLIERLNSGYSYPQTSGNLQWQVDTLYIQMRDMGGGYSERSVPVTAYGNTTENNGTFDNFIFLQTNDKHHVYGLMTARADSVKLFGKMIPCDRKYSNILCCFDYKGNLIWAFNVCSFENMAGPGTLITQLCTYQIDESGTGYFTGVVYRYDVWVLGDFFEFKDYDPRPFPMEETFVVRISAEGKPLNKKFFNTVRGKFSVNARFKERLYFKSWVFFNYNDQYGFSNKYTFDQLGYVFSGLGQDLKTERGVVVGELDTNFRVLWYKVLPVKRLELSLDVFQYTNAFVNDANELVFGAVRQNRVSLNDKTYLFSDSAGNAYQPVILKVSQSKNFEAVYKFGYTNPSFQRQGFASTFYQICQGRGDEIFAYFNPPSGWGIENDYFEYNPPRDNNVIFAKISNAAYEEPESISASIACNVVTARFATDNIPDSLIWNWGDGTQTKGRIEAVHTYTQSGAYKVIGRAWHNGVLWADTLTLDIVVLDSSRFIDAPDTLDVCGTSVSVRMKSLPAGTAVTWSNGTTSSETTTNVSGWLSASITTLHGCTRTDSVFVKFSNPLPPSPIPAEIRLCPGDSHIYTITMTDTAIQWQWPDGSSGLTYSVSGTGLVKLNARRGSCTEEYRSMVYVTDTSQRFRFDPPEVIVRKDGPGVSLHVPESAGKVTWPDSSQGSDYLLSVRDTGLLTVKIDDGCRPYYTSVRVRLEEECRLYIPSAFTPDANGLNPHFLPVSNCSWSLYHLAIYNRWGQRIWESTQPGQGWDGTHQGAAVPDGVYLYMLQYRNSSGAPGMEKGPVHVIRR